MGTVTVEPDESLNLSDLHRAISDAGFERASTEVSVVGAVSRVADPRHESALLLRRMPSGQPVWLVPGETEQTQRTLKELGRGSGESSEFRVNGLAHVHADGSVVVAPRTFEVARRGRLWTE